MVRPRNMALVRHVLDVAREVPSDAHGHTTRHAASHIW